MSDAMVAADELCEILMRSSAAERRQERYALLDEAGDQADACVAEVARRGFAAQLFAPGDGELLSRWLLALEARAELRPLFAQVIAAGQYERAIAILRGERAALEALARARPDWNQDSLNAPALALGGDGLIIVPGYTPLDARRPLRVHEIPALCRRLEEASGELAAERASRILVSGGAVHPAGTPFNEALGMREHLLTHGVPAEQILVEPYARHSTTNLRNAGRLMRRLGVARAIIVTGYESEPFDQAFYFAHPILSTFHQRCREELGYRVGALREIESHRIAFEPAAEVDRVDVRDPLDC